MPEEQNIFGIEPLSALEVVRRKPELFLGNLKDPQLNTGLALQTLCHAIDEAIEGNCQNIKIQVGCTEIKTQYDAGLPLKPHPLVEQLPTAMIFLTIHNACCNLKKNIEVGSELCQLGLAALNAVCSSFVVTTTKNSEQATFIFEKGALKNSPHPETCDKNDSTEITFQLDQTILPNTLFDFSSIKNEVIHLLEKYEISLQIEEVT